MTSAALAVPGDINTLTGGYIYDRRLFEELGQAGRDMRLIRLPDGFPFPSADDMRKALEQLQSLPADSPVVIDGLAFGALATDGVSQIAAPIVALVHHPLAFESGMPAAQQRNLLETERNNLRYAAQIIVPSPHTKTILIDRYDVPPSKIHIARPGSDLPRRSSSARRSPLGPPLILSVGILHPRKGHDVLIDALARIADLEWRASIVGNPWENGHAEALSLQIDRSGLSERVHLAGRVGQDALARLYEQSSIFALATRYEGYGIVFNEALSYGLPIVSCRTGAVPDTVPAGAGLLVERDDPTAFAKALRSLLIDNDKCAAMAAVAASSGAALSSWAETARIAGQALDAAARSAK